MDSDRPVSRRRFLQRAAAASALPGILGTAAAASANDRIGLGFIGVGVMARGHVLRFLAYKDVQVLAVADVVKARREYARQTVEDQYRRASGGKRKYKCATYNDFRDLLARPDIDAVVIATPDHWHAIPCVLAAQAGKDIYCEKPLTHTIAEGRKIVEAVARRQRVFQTGSQQRCEYNGVFRHACAMVRGGLIGKVKTIHVGVGDPAIACDLPEERLSAGIDWDFWLGPAPQRPFNSILCPRGITADFPAWRRYREYGGGGLADMGAHHFDIAQWALDMDSSGPVKIEPPPGTATRGLKFTYANGVEMIHGGASGCTFEGELGMIYVDRGRLESKPASLLKDKVDNVHLYACDDHSRNWVACMRTRKPTICPAEVGHRSATVCHLANIGYRLRRPLRWDPAAEQFVGDAEANRLAQISMRPPWKI